MPVPMKYSILAGKVILLGRTSGSHTESENDRWLLAKMAGPSRGTFSRPSTQGRKTVLSNGPRAKTLRNQ